MKLIIDTHIWLWWVDRTGNLTALEESIVDEAARNGGVGVCAISCWEIAMNVNKGRIKLTMPVDEWVRKAVAFSGVHLVPLTPAIAVASVGLPGEFHGDPADRFIVATARFYDLPLVTRDGPIRAYTHVRLAP